jgi:hypothetical protein
MTDPSEGASASTGATNAVTARAVPDDAAATSAEPCPTHDEEAPQDLPTESQEPVANVHASALEVGSSADEVSNPLQ